MEHRHRPNRINAYYFYFPRISHCETLHSNVVAIPNVVISRAGGRCHSREGGHCHSREGGHCHSREGGHCHSRAGGHCHSRAGGNPVLTLHSSKYVVTKLPK